MSIEGDWSFVTDITTTKLYNNTDCKASLFVIGKAQQWGVGPNKTGGSATVTFNLAFNSTCFGVVGTDYTNVSSSDTGGVDFAVYFSTITTTSFRVSKESAVMQATR